MLMNHSSTKPENKLRFAAPAGRVTVSVCSHPIQQTFTVGGPRKSVQTHPIHAYRLTSRNHPQNALHPPVVQSAADRTACPKLKVFCSTAGRDMDNTGALSLSNLIPQYHLMRLLVLISDTSFTSSLNCVCPPACWAAGRFIIRTHHSASLPFELPFELRPKSDTRPSAYALFPSPGTAPVHSA
jgi:hypothetical protein